MLAVAQITNLDIHLKVLLNFKLQDKKLAFRNSALSYPNDQR